MKLMSVKEIEAYFEGKRQGIRLFAWCKDGECFAGITGCTLKRAIEEVDHDEKSSYLRFVKRDEAEGGER